jgi:hypothetical protein
MPECVILFIESPFIPYDASEIFTYVNFRLTKEFITNYEH